MNNNNFNILTNNNHNKNNNNNNKKTGQKMSLFNTKKCERRWYWTGFIDANFLKPENKSKSFNNFRIPLRELFNNTYIVISSINNILTRRP